MTNSPINPANQKMIGFKYYDGQTVMVGDSIVGRWCGTCEIIKCDNEEVVARNICTNEIFELKDYTYNCDLLGRKD